VNRYRHLMPSRPLRPGVDLMSSQAPLPTKRIADHLKLLVALDLAAAQEQHAEPRRAVPLFVADTPHLPVLRSFLVGPEPFCHVEKCSWCYSRRSFEE
jgi:hypothetical protein